MDQFRWRSNATPSYPFNATITHHQGYFPLYFHVLIITIAIIVFLIGICGNSMVIYVIVRNSNGRMQSTFHYLVASLSCYDIFVLLISMPQTLTYDLTLKWPFGLIACYLSSNLPMLFACGSVFTMVAIALDRYKSIRDVFHIITCNKRRKLLIIAVIFGLSLAFMLPCCIYTRYYDDLHYPQCWVAFSPDPFISNVSYVLFLTFIVLLIPFGTIFFLYGGMIYSLHKVRHRIVDIAPAQNIYNIATRQSIQMLVLIVATFILTWLPLFTCFNIAAFGKISQPQIKPFRMIYTISHLISYTNSLIDPIVYAVYSRTFLRNHSSQG